MCRRKTSWFALGLVAWMGLANAAAQASTSNLIVDGSVRYQVIDGAGPNINADVWYGGAGAAAIDLWTGIGAATLFRVVYEPTDWVSSQSLIPDLHTLDAATLDAVYNQNPRFADLWGMIGYLNSKGVHGDQILVNFQGWTAAWIGGSGGQGSPSYISPGHEQDFATMVASLMYYGKVVKGLDFNSISPFNEPDQGCTEGPCLSASQMQTIVDDLVQELDRMGLSGVHIVAPTLVNYAQANLAAYADPLHADAAVNTRIPRYDTHEYADMWWPPPYSSPPATWWLTETGRLCLSCDTGTCDPTPGWPWTWSTTTADKILQAYVGGFGQPGMTGAMFWIGTESVELQEGTPPPKNCYPTIRLDTSTQVFTPDIGLYALAIPFRAAQPNRSVVSTSTTLTFTQTPVAFYDPVQGGFAIAGHTNRAVTMVGQLNNLPVVSRLQLFETDSSGSKNAARQPDVAVTGQAFSVQIPADTLFELEAPASASPPPPPPTCPTTPQTCRTSEKSTLLVVRNDAQESQDRLVWRWIKGTSTNQVDFGDPTSTTDYTFCLYAGSAQALVGEVLIPASSIKWRATGTTGYRYADPSASADGITRAMLKSGTQNPPAVRLNGKGAGLPHPPLPATAPVTVQLFNGSNGLCWGSSYTASQLINNQPWQLKAQAG